MVEKPSGIETGPRLVSWVRVRGRPFQARFWRACDQTLEPIVGEFARNSAGAERRDSLLRVANQPDIHLAEVRLFDPGELIFVETAQRLIIGRDRLDQQGLQFAVEFMPEKRVIEGLDCRLVKFADQRTGIGEGELWWSEDLQVPVLDNPTGRQVTYRLFDIRRNDPPPELFDLRGFRDFDAQGIFDLACCEGVYVVFNGNPRMTRVPKSVRFVLGIGLSIGVWGQQRPEWACAFQPHMSAAKVVGKPFSADYRLTANAGGVEEIVVQSGRIHRNAEGSVRNECQAKLDQDDSHLIAFIQIEPDGRLIVLDTSSRLVLADSGAVSPLVSGRSGTTARDQSGWFFYYGAPEFSKDHRRISGESCRLVRLKATHQEGEPTEAVDSSIEICWSDELQVALMEQFVREGTPYALMLSNVRRVPPPPSLFSIPAGFGGTR